MVLTFPNPSRSYDADKNRVSFWAYDRAIEVTFFVEKEALQKLWPEILNVEADFLQAFDKFRQRIHDVASQIYAHAPQSAYAFSLAAKDF